MKKKIVSTIVLSVMILSISLINCNHEVSAKSTLYGDVNGDGKITIKDIILLQKYVNKGNGTIETDLSDVYKDGKIDKKDVEVLIKHYLGFKAYKDLPYEPIWGDVNGDNEVDVDDIAKLQQYVAGWNVKIKEELADVYQDGKIDENDIEVLQKHLAGWKKYKELPYKPVCGDVNGDGNIDVDDITQLQKYVAGWNVKIKEELADVYQDGKIDEKDIGVLQKHLAGWKKYKELPCTIE